MTPDAANTVPLPSQPSPSLQPGGTYQVVSTLPTLPRFSTLLKVLNLLSPNSPKQTAGSPTSGLIPIQPAFTSVFPL